MFIRSILHIRKQKLFASIIESKCQVYLHVMWEKESEMLSCPERGTLRHEQEMEKKKN